MLVHPGFQFYNSNHFFLLLVDHGERFGDVTHLHRVHHLTDFLRQFGHFEFRSAVIVTFKVLVHHQTFVISRILVGRDKSRRFFKCKLLCRQVIIQGIHTCHTLVQLLVRNFRLQQNMAAVDTVATLFDQLNDMITIFSLHDLRNLFRVLQVESYICKFRQQACLTQKSQFSTPFG